MFHDHHPFLWGLICLSVLCVCGWVGILGWGGDGVTFPVSRTTACLIFLLSSSQQRNLTLQGLSILSLAPFLGLSVAAPR